ncbi:MAG: cell division protein FtsZ [Bacteroidales bacterium]|nr:cell division protein FtsZ [Bacteroidales bacterium]
MDDLLPFDLPTNFASIIKVLGVGGGGSNAVNHMLRQGIEGVDFIIANTDIQALEKSPVRTKIQLGKTLTEGLGAGNKPDVGKEAAIESIEDVKTVLGAGTKMVFITAGMGGGTGTGGAPVIAEAAKELGILTVGIVTIPFRYEGSKRIESAIQGIAEMEKHVDALLIINNEKIREIYGNLAITDALGKADEVLTVAAKGIAEIITIEGHVNVDFADVKTVMKSSGIALMGTGVAEGENRAKVAVKDALNSPLLDNTDIKGASNILLNISSGKNIATLDEISFINEYVQKDAGNRSDLIWGSNIDEELGDKIAVTVIATGFGTHDIPELYSHRMLNSKEETKTEKEIIEIGKENTQKEVAETDDFFSNYEKPQKITVKTVSKTEEEKDIVFFNNAVNDEEKKENDSEFEFVETPQVNDITFEEKQTNSKKLQVNNYLKHLNDLENVPAYKRKGIIIDQNNFPDNRQYSRFTLSDENGEINLNENNSYLHDKAD